MRWDVLNLANLFSVDLAKEAGCKCSCDCDCSGPINHFAASKAEKSGYTMAEQYDPPAALSPVVRS
jgi:hypothetical protein